MTSYSLTEAWLRSLQNVAATGERVAPRGIPTRELAWQQLEVSNPMTFPMAVHGREMRDVIGVLEGLSLVGEFNVPELFTDRVRNFGQFQDGGVFWGSYGARAHGSFGDVVDLLKRDPDSRQAVVTLYDSGRDLNREKKDIPCTISGQFLMRERRDGPETEDIHWYLDLGISMRSNDLWLGTPYDFVQFAIWQASVAQALGARVGRYVHRVGSLHLYDRDAEKASGLSFAGAPDMPFPLWGAATGAGIQSRARMLLLGDLDPMTHFEQWAGDLVHVGYSK